MTTVPPSLVGGVRLLSLDAGNTVVFFDHARLASICEAAGHAVGRFDLEAAEGRAKRRHLDDAMETVAWAHDGAPGARAWGQMIGTLVVEAGAPRAAVRVILERAWAGHVRKNLWSVVPEGLRHALARLASTGVKLGVVSNSEGMLDALFRSLALRELFHVFLDSGVVGVEKPDPRIFDMVRAPFGFAADEVLHLGDMVSTDIVGARRAGMRAALIDPFGHFDALEPDVTRVESVVAVVEAMLASSAR